MSFEERYAHEASFAPSPETLAAQRVLALIDFNRLPEARTEIYRALATYPEDPELLSIAAWIEHFSGSAATARDLAQATLAARPSDWRALMVLIELSVRDQKFDEAIRHSDTMLSYYPHDATTHLNAAFVHASDDREKVTPKGSSRVDMVRGFAFAAVELEPENPRVLSRAAGLVQGMGLYPQAKMLNDRALALAPSDSDLLLRASSLEANERKSLKLLRGALSQDPGDASSRAYLSRKYWAILGAGPAILTLILAAMAYWFAFLFGTDADTMSHQNLVRLAAVFWSPLLAWFIILVAIPTRMPRGYPRTVTRRARWIWFGHATQIVACLGLILLAAGIFTHMGQAHQQMFGPDPTGRIQFLTWVLALALISETIVTLARVRAEHSEGLYDTTMGGILRSELLLKESRILLIIRGSLALITLLVPFVFASHIEWPAVPSGFFAAALAILIPPLVGFLTRHLLHRSLIGGVPRFPVLVPVVVSLVGMLIAFYVAVYTSAAFEPEAVCLTCHLQPSGDLPGVRINEELQQIQENLMTETP